MDGVIEFIRKSPDETMASLIILGLILSYFIGSIPFGLILSKAFGHGDIRKIGSGNIGATNVLRTGNKNLGLATLILDASKGVIAITLVFLMLQYLGPTQGYNCTKTLGTVAIENNQLQTISGTTTCEGYKPVFNAKEIFNPGNHAITYLALALGLFAILGHCFPIWLKLKGGKGVATGIGVLLVTVPYAGLAACAAWIATAKITKYSSLSALIAFLIAPIVTLFVYRAEPVTPFMHGAEPETPFLYGAGPAAICALITLLIWVRHKDNIKRLLKGEESKIGQKNNPHPEENASEPVSK